jgi:phosphopentomutase
MRAIVIVLDSFGVGELPDASLFGDKGSDTFGNIVKKIPNIKIDNLNELGLGNIDDVKGISKCDKPIGCYAKMAESSAGKDTTVGHWELAGVITQTAFPTYPNGFPADVMQAFEKAIGRKTIGNYSSSGTVVLDELGEEHVQTGSPIIYTSADSVFQIAAHEDVITIDELYKMCEIAREVLGEEHEVARIIARPFIGEAGNYSRTKNRKDFSVDPPSKTVLEFIKEAGQSVAAVGKIEDIFCGIGITESIHTKNNMDSVDKTIEFMNTIENGLIFSNLVDFDMMYGHRNDVVGYANALEEFDKRLPEIYENLKEDDILFITADHGCDPTMPGTDHSREFVPVLVYGHKVNRGINFGIRKTFADIAATIAQYLEVKADISGESFLEQITERKA